MEIGVVCNAGEKGWTQIRLANVGCCTVRYSWRHLPHVDHFNTGRHRRSPFIFNCSGGILLPEEKVRLCAVRIVRSCIGHFNPRETEKKKRKRERERERERERVS